ncbi:PQQ-dependent sugar dehydrogenase [Bacillus safensis]|uniref:PQQ-dependent sugar dehydrogenase n=1 Tax=Bacillus safensis TaxID=561879 RepID=UPI000ABA758A|nr:PQQ-dependent sugar dehydrogenase [Bacillus safensis]
MKRTLLVATSIFILASCQNDQNIIQNEDNVEDTDTNNTEPNRNEEASDTNSAYNFLEMTTEDWDLEVISDDLTYPWDIRVLEDLIIMPELDGNMVVIQDGELERYELETSEPILQSGGSGLLGLELSDNFMESGIAFVYYTYNSSSGLTNRVVQIEFDGDSWIETNVLLDGIPGHELYNGGRIAIGPDAHLYVTTGWAREGDFSQDLDSLGGKILRMQLDGSIPEDNPFADSYVYSYGHRNPQGLAWNEDGTVMYSSEHGEAGNDEINIIEAGNNYGWPEIEGEQEQDNMEAPLVHSGNETWAPSGITFFEGNLFVTGLRGQSLYILNEETNSLDEVFTSNERLRNVYTHNNGLYLITTNTSPRSGNLEEGDRVLRINPAQ